MIEAAIRIAGHQDPVTGERFHTFSELTFSGTGPGETPDNLVRHGH